MERENAKALTALLNEMFIELFNDINKIEERSMRLASGDELTVTEVHTVETIGGDEPKRMSDVAAKLKITVSTLTISVNKLVSKGYVERFRCTEDRRVVKVGLTSKGMRILKLHAAFHEKMINSIVDSLSEAENDILVRCIERLMNFFKDEDAKTTRMLEGRKTRWR